MNNQEAGRLEQPGGGQEAGGGQEGGGAVARACLSIEEVVDVLVELGVAGRDVVAARADRLVLVARRGDRGELGRGEGDVRTGIPTGPIWPKPLIVFLWLELRRLPQILCWIWLLDVRSINTKLATFYST